MYYDSHTHLNSQELYPERFRHVQDFIAIGGKGLVTIGVGEEWNERNLTIARQYAAHDQSPFLLKCAIGYHPSEVSTNVICSSQDIQKAIDTLTFQLDTSREHIVALGECGTDLHYATTPAQHLLQKELFAQQCQLAQAYNLPVVVHSRDDFPGTREVIERFPTVIFYIHCRGYGAEQMRQVCSTRRTGVDTFIGFCGNLSYPKATELRTSLAELVTSTQQAIPHCLLLETDAPYLAPQAYRGQQNTPAYIASLYAFVAEQLGCELSELQETVQHTFKRCYQLT